MPGSRLGPLALETKLGDHPSLSSVWRAVHVKQQKTVAVKVFPVAFGGTPEARREFAQEWERLKEVQHPAIARCYGGGFERHDAYLAYEFIDGETLSSTLERRERLSWEAVLDMAEPLVDALEFLHGQHLAHGRLQPDKVVVAGLSPVLLDVRVSRDAGPFTTGRPLGATDLAYRPPELIDDPEAISFSGDLYALGMVMYRCLTGRVPFDTDDEASLKAAVKSDPPLSPASIVMECPVWLDRLVMQLLHKNPASRPSGTVAVKAALGEVRKRSMSRAGGAEHVTAGFSPLQVTDQKDRDEARVLLGHELVDLEEEAAESESSWYDRPIVLIASLFAVIGLVAYLVWPLDESGLRDRAEALLAEGHRGSLIQAKISYLEPMLKKYPEGQHAGWASEQIERVEMVEAEHALSVKLKRNLPLSNEGERLYAEARRFERFGDTAAALDQYRSLVTLMGDQSEYRPFVNLARRQIASIENDGQRHDEAARILQNKLAEADAVYRKGNVVAARQIWYSIVDLYRDNANVAPLVQQAQDRLADLPSGRSGS